MAKRGTPLPFSQRQMIRNMRQARETLRRVAATMQVSVNTVRKYEDKFDTNVLSQGPVSARMDRDK